MEISRVDPFLVRWSNDGTIALATESADLQFLKINPVSLEEAEIKWIRSRLNLKERVLDMRWSETLNSQGSGCFLACLLNSGDVCIVETDDEPCVVRYIKGEYSSVNWQADQLIVGDEHGNILKYHGEETSWNSQLPRKVSILCCQPGSSLIGAVLSDNSCWIWSEEWKMVTAPSRFFVNCAKIVGDKLVSLRCGKVFVNEKAIPLLDYSPGEIVHYADNWAIGHSDGHISQLEDKISIPKIQGDLIYIDIHQFLPIGLAILNTGSSASHYPGWKFPILSSQQVSVYLFPILGALNLPRRRDFASPVSWLACKIHEKAPEAKATDSFSLPDVDLMEDSSLTEQLRELFLSEWFDNQRLKWFLGVDRGKTLAECREAIANLIYRYESNGALDQVVKKLYSGDELSFHLKGDFVDDIFSVANENNSKVFQQLNSSNGRLWKQCALTLLPLLSINTHQSEDGDFTIYVRPPRLIREDISEGAEADEDRNPIVEALLASASFCPFTGCNWLKYK